MLTPVPGGAAVVACNSCRSAAGAALVAALRRVQAGDAAYAAVAVQEMPCLFACRESCTVHLRAPGKVSYVLGRFDPTEEAARAILDYARAYAESEWGQVPYRDWPAGVKGHFITRSPPEGFVVA
ncbi:MAG: DUF1636 domain-containing protein [Sphingomonadales bacterium]|nr:DUF1636 domain-containing protein [Sphingomonadales bacterium]